MRRLGIKIGKSSSVPHIFSIIISGEQQHNTMSCIFYLGTTLKVSTYAKRTKSLEEGHWIAPRIWYNLKFGVQPKAKLQQLLEDSARGVVNDLYLELARAKD